MEGVEESILIGIKEWGDGFFHVSPEENKIMMEEEEKKE